MSTTPNITRKTMVRVADRKYMVFRPKFRMYLAVMRVDTAGQSGYP
jgi:hypothetical protein